MSDRRLLRKSKERDRIGSNIDPGRSAMAIFVKSATFDAPGGATSVSSTDAIESEVTQPKIRLKPTKILPTDRLTTENQLNILRAYVAASGTDRNAVANSDVEKVANISANSVSLCNGFFNEIGLLFREGIKQRPTDAAFDYFQAHQWKPDTASTKLGPCFAQSWFGKALLPKLTFRQLTKDEALGFLAEEAKAGVEYRKSLEIAVEYLIAAGLVRLDGNTLSIVAATPIASAPSPPKDGIETKVAASQSQPDPDCFTFTIPIPNKKVATVTFPSDLDSADWQMVTEMMAAYVKRLKGFEAKP